ncbi:MAG: prenyltransferase [Flavobacteriales bacterium CG_4_9_14_0_2_um_filter_35_242]|nr:UbiA family prenyltransferase [Zetaproteobacteria bacterium]PJA04550.1 MAG: prenyltransferase [Flavobacteriales bacterium CG_4_10_14_0_2_um_filter_35_18]PJC60438.1 MAG: prenyltransferase [Flavobacteriales bacterium CG_4_9_14_0_2_um_filter_35_242]
MQYFFKLIRFKNLIIIAFSQILFKYFFLNKSGIALQLTTPLFLLLLFALLFIAAAGYVINDIYDLESDKINKTHAVIIGTKISERTAMKVYIVFNIIGLGLAYYLSFAINHLNYALLFLALAFGLLKYSQSWKNILILKNVLVAFLVSLSILILGFYDSFPTMNPANAVSQMRVFNIIIAYFVFAFLINLIREIVKDIEDLKGDEKRKTRTIISVYGLKTTKRIVSFLNAILILLTAYFTYLYFALKIISLLYMIGFVFVPAILNLILLLMATEQKHFKNSTQLLKILMLFGIGSIVLI